MAIEVIKNNSDKIKLCRRLSLWQHSIYNAKQELTVIDDYYSDWSKNLPHDGHFSPYFVTIHNALVHSMLMHLRTIYSSGNGSEKIAKNKGNNSLMNDIRKELDLYIIKIINITPEDLANYWNEIEISVDGWIAHNDADKIQIEVLDNQFTYSVNPKMLSFFGEGSGYHNRQKMKIFLDCIIEFLMNKINEAQVNK